MVKIDYHLLKHLWLCVALLEGNEIMLSIHFHEGSIRRVVESIYLSKPEMRK